MYLTRFAHIIMLANFLHLIILHALNMYVNKLCVLKNLVGCMSTWDTNYTHLCCKIMTQNN